MRFSVKGRNAPGAAIAIGGLLSIFAGPVAAQPVDTMSPTSVDQEFVTQAVRGGNMEIEEAQAQLGSSDAGIRLYAQTIIRDHAAANGQIIAVAKSLNLTYPESRVQVGEGNDMGTPPPGGSNATAMPADAYMKKEVTDHQRTIALFKGEAANGARQLRTVAAQILPILQSHLAMAEQYLKTGHVSPEVTPSPSAGMGP